MSTTRGLWLISLPLALVSSLGAHAAAYRLVAPGEHAHERLLAETGHAYLAHAPLFVAAAVGVLVAGTLAAAARPRARLSPWPFALLAPSTFALQEHVERLVHLDAFPLHAALEPAVWIGLALQLPFAVLAYLVARVALVVADRLLNVAPPRTVPSAPARLDPLVVASPTLRWLSRGRRQRAPPPLLAV